MKEIIIRKWIRDKWKSGKLSYLFTEEDEEELVSLLENAQENVIQEHECVFGDGFECTICGKLVF